MMARGRGKFRNYYVKRWILEALASQHTPTTASGTLDIIKSNLKKKDGARRSPNLSTAKLSMIMMGMPEIGYTRGRTTSIPHVYWLKKMEKTPN
jgi:hypothetical protein